MKRRQLEILLITDSRFSSRQLCEKLHAANKTKAAIHNVLEEACWNGLIREMLPELYLNVRNCKQLTLWKLTRAEHFLELDYGEQSLSKETLHSLNPYFFLRSLQLS